MKIALLGGMILIAWATTAKSAEPSSTEKTIGINPAYRNLSVKPGDDFEEYANGGWRKTAEIPADRASTGVGFEVFERAEKRNADLVREAVAANPPPDTPRGMIAAYYAAFMDTANIEKRGLDPLKEKLREIDAIKTKTDLARVHGERLRADVDPLNATVMWTENLFGVWVTQALSEPDRTVPYLLQGGLGMPDREYYLSNEPEMAEQRAAYQTYVGDLMKLAGRSDPAGRAERIVTLEKKMASVHIDRVTSQDVHKANNPATLADLKSNAPGLDWDAYLSAAGLEKQPMFIMWQPGAIKGLSALVGSEPLETWKEWFVFHTISQNTAYLPQAYYDLRFGFYGKTLEGTPKQLERWKRAIANINEDLGDALGKIYVAKYFPPSSKAAVQEMVKNLLAGFDLKADAAANYGAIGATIGHEISHSFDNAGAEFNSEGKLANWWTPEDAAHFKAASQRLVEEFNKYEPLPGLHVNGEQTLGENIADVAGLSAAYDAYKLSLHRKELPVVDGLTGDQRFFLAFAQSWRKKIRDAALRSQIVTNEHAPSRERAQTVRNIDAWYDAYGVKPGEKLYLESNERVRIW